MIAMNKIPEWFPGARLNYAENLLRYSDDSRVALYFTSERLGVDGIRTRTFGQLKERVRYIAASLRKLGVGPGDRVVGYIPNCPEAIEAMAATASIGAVWSSTSPDFGVSGVLDRFSQIQPKVVFSVEAVSYNLKTHDHLAKLSQVVGQLDSVEKVVVIPFVNSQEEIDCSTIKNSIFLDDFLQLGAEEDGSVPPLVYHQVKIVKKYLK
jgi:acetoacetyl-CoA synthetase